MEGVEYCNYIREWRFKWKSEASLLACQIALESIFDDLIAIDGVKNVERLVCDECQDFKVCCPPSIIDKDFLLGFRHFFTIIYEFVTMC